MIVNIIKKYKSACYSFLLALVLAVVTFSISQRMLFGKYTIMASDFWGQIIPYVRLFWKKIFEGNDLFDIGTFFYSFSDSLGGNIAPQYAFYACFSPFNILYLFFSDNVASCMVVVLKVAMAAFFFNVFAKKVLKKDGKYTIIFSSFYALSAYIIAFYFNVQYLEGFMILPLLLTLCYGLIEEGRFVGLSFCYGYIFITNFYSGYILGIFSFVTFILYLFICSGKKGKDLFIILVKFGVAVLLAFGLSAFLMVPTLLYAFTHKAGDASAFKGLTLNLLDIYGNFFIGMNQKKEGVIPYIYCGIPVLFGAPYFFITKKYNKKVKIFAGISMLFLILCSLISPLYLFMHAFDKPDTCGFRFSYFISFMMVALLVYVWEDLIEASKKYFIYVAVINIIIYIIVMCVQKLTWAEEYQGASVLGLEINGIFLCLYMFLIGIKKCGAKNGIIAVIVAVELIANGSLFLINMKYSIAEYKEIYAKINDQCTEVFNEIHAEDDSFYRVYLKHCLTENYLCLQDAYGLSLFNSIENLNLRETLYRFGYSTSPRVVIDYGGTPATRMLFGQKYNIYNYGVIYDTTIEKATYERNECTLGLGYMVNDKLYDYSFTSNPFININQFLSALTDTDVQYFINYDGQVNVLSEGMDVNVIEGTNVIETSLMEGYEKGHLYYQYDIEGKDLSYAYSPVVESSNIRSTPTIHATKGDVGNILNSSLVVMPHVIEVERNDDGIFEVVVYAANTMKVPYTVINDLYVVSADDSELKKAYDILSKNQLEINEIQDGYIDGNINVEGNDIMFLSIPYDVNWKLYVDDVETEIIPAVNNTFITAKLPQGSHHVVLMYKNNAVTYGMIGGIISLIILIVISVVSGKMSENKSEPGDEAVAEREQSASKPELEPEGEQQGDEKSVAETGDEAVAEREQSASEPESESEDEQQEDEQ